MQQVAARFEWSVLLPAKVTARVLYCWVSWW